MRFHPVLTDPQYSTILLSWFDGRLHFLEPVPSQANAIILLDVYYFSYLLCFIAAGLFIWRTYKTGRFKVKAYQAIDLLGVGILGVLLGAKLGYVLFYNFEYYLEHPADIFLNWSGMASHGALAGSIIALILYAKKAKLSILHVLDHASFAAAMGPIFIRIANFLNGELFGRSTDLSWGMHFPLRSGLGQSLFIAPNDQIYALNHSSNNSAFLEPYQGPIAGAHESFTFVKNELTNQIYSLPLESGSIETVARLITDPRHPSQIYQWFFSGVVVFAALLWIRSKTHYVGTVTASFFILWGGSRILMEFFRQQDVQRSEGLFSWISMGQLLSLAVVGAGVYLLKRRRAKIEDLRGPEAT